MNDLSSPGDRLNQWFLGCLLEVLVRSGIISDVASYPPRQALARKISGQQGLAATLLALDYQSFTGWVADRSNAKLPPVNADTRHVQ